MKNFFITPAGMQKARPNRPGAAGEPTTSNDKERKENVNNLVFTLPAAGFSKPVQPTSPVVYYTTIHLIRFCLSPISALFGPVKAV